jgi:mannose-6-phosphate isomerase-like protein (cupin superfamily)
MGLELGASDPARSGGEAAISFAAASRLHFQSVEAAEGGDGKVEVAIALSVNNSYTGVLEVPARTDTGPQRALKGDEFFFVHAGQVILQLGDSRYHLHAGDHVAIPNMTCYSFHNGTGSRCCLVFFVPRNPYG